MATYHPVVLLAPIGDHRPMIERDAMRAAVAPAAFSEAETVIDLTDGADGTSLDADVARIAAGVEAARHSTDELAVFGFAPIPLLVALGRLLGDKRAARVFDRLRPTGTLTWEDGPADALEWRYEPQRRPSPERKDIAALLSVSGTVDHRLIARWLPDAYDLYEIKVPSPAPSVVRSEAQLDGFRVAWRRLLDDVRQNHGPDARIHLFPAVPISVAIECGRRLLPKADPDIRVYDLREGAFHYALSISGPTEAVRVELAARVPRRADLLVLIALPEEFRILRQLVPPMLPVDAPLHGGQDYFSAIVEGGQRRAVVFRLAGVGIDEAQLATDRAIATWRPQTTVNIGIAGLMDSDVKLCDVVVADQVDAYDANLKATDRGEDDWVLGHRGAVFQGSHGLLQEVRHFEFTHAERYEVWRNGGPSPEHGTSIHPLVPAQATLWVGHVASGSMLGASKAFKQWLRGRDAKFLAIEMEAAGVARAVSKREESGQWLIIRGISDGADAGKGELDDSTGGAIRRRAMENATRLFLALIGSGVL